MNGPSLSGRYIVAPRISTEIEYPQPVAAAIKSYTDARAQHAELARQVRTAQEALNKAKADDAAALADAIAASSGSPKVSTKLAQLERDLEYHQGLEYTAWQHVLKVGDEFKATYREHGAEILTATLDFAERACTAYDEEIPQVLAAIQERFQKISEAAGLLGSWNSNASEGTTFHPIAVSPEVRLPRANQTGNIPQLVAQLRARVASSQAAG